MNDLLLVRVDKPTGDVLDNEDLFRTKGPQIKLPAQAFLRERHREEIGFQVQAMGPDRDNVPMLEPGLNLDLPPESS